MLVVWVLDLLNLNDLAKRLGEAIHLEETKRSARQTVRKTETPRG